VLWWDTNVLCKWRQQQGPLKHLYPTTTLYGVTSQKTATGILTTMRTLYLESDGNMFYSFEAEGTNYPLLFLYALKVFTNCFLYMGTLQSHGTEALQ